MINVYHGGQIINTSISVGYVIYAACSFYVDDTINIHDDVMHSYICFEPCLCLKSRLNSQSHI
jgi:hypothetical protein